MSRRKDGGFPRKKHGNCNKPLRAAEREGGKRRDQLGDLDAPTSSKTQRSGERPPPGLKGRDLGMWYRNRQVKKNKQDEEDRIPNITLPRDRFEEIEELLFQVGKVRRNQNTDDLMEDGFFKNAFFKKISGTFEDSMAKNLNIIENKPDLVLSQQMKKRLLHKIENDGKYREMMTFREKLPCFKKKKELLDAITNNQVVVISGETGMKPDNCPCLGCGKTTQIAQFVLDQEILEERGSQCSIVCTQPRRISAISVAERVAAERNEKLGESVGYQIRLEKILPKQTRGAITFVTTGIILQWIQGNPTLNGVSHLFLDEVHERDILCDFTIACLKQILVKRPDMKLILMSATLNAERFSRYFNNTPCIEVPGFTYPVEEIYLDQIIEKTGFKFREGRPTAHMYGKNRKAGFSAEFDQVIIPHVRNLQTGGLISKETAAQLSKTESERLNVDLIEALIHYICVNEDEGAILVFVPGLSEITKINKQLLSRPFFRNDRFIIVPLHSTLPTINQRRVFNRPPKGVRKIIIATNIAETSITIDDVVYVVDSGYIKMTNFNMELNVNTLDSQWVSEANARQRRGRAGRVAAGKCYKLYTSARESMFEPYPLPEMQRTRLEEVVLQVKMLQLGKVGPFLSTVLDPPDPMAVDMALHMLDTLNAVDENEDLTPLGFHLAKLPLDPQTGKMILMSAIFGCVDPVLSVAAALSFKDPFNTPIGKENEVRRIKESFAGSEKSDHLVLIAAFSQWEEADDRKKGYQFAYDHYMSHNTLVLLKDMKRQFARHLHEMNFLRTGDPKDENGNTNSRNLELVKAVICSGLYPNVAMIKSIKNRTGGQPSVLLKTAEHFRVELHPRSICCKMTNFNSPLFVYHLMLKSSAIFLHDVTMVSPWALLFFGKKLDIVETENGHAIRVDQLTKFYCFKKTGMLIQKLRRHLDWILANSVSNPGVIDWSEISATTELLKAIVKLITADNDEMMMMQLEEWE